MGEALVYIESKSKKDLGASLVVPGRQVKKTAGQGRGHGFDPGSSKFPTGCGATAEACVPKTRAPQEEGPM